MRIMRNMLLIDLSTTNRGTSPTKSQINLCSIRAINRLRNYWMTRSRTGWLCRTSSRRSRARNSWMPTAPPGMPQVPLKQANWAFSSKGTQHRCPSRHIQISMHNLLMAHLHINLTLLSRDRLRTPSGSPQGCRTEKVSHKSTVQVP